MSLLARISGPDGGPVRTKSASRISPYSRQPRHPKGNSNALWSHDLFENLNEGSPQPKQLSTRLTSSATGPMLVSNFLVTRALREAAASSDPSQSSGPLSIKGASGSSGNVVQVEGLVNGTTPADVEAIFRRCGCIVSSESVTLPTSNNVVVRLTFKRAGDAKDAVTKFDGQPADGRTLRVRIVAAQAVSLHGRIAGGDELMEGKDSVDDLINSNRTAESKLRSDAILKDDSRAIVLVSPSPHQRSGAKAPPQRGPRGGGGGRRGRGRGRPSGVGGGSDQPASMEID